MDFKGRNYPKSDLVFSSAVEKYDVDTGSSSFTWGMFTVQITRGAKAGFVGITLKFNIKYELCY